jgi:hypothetical protein
MRILKLEARAKKPIGEILFKGLLVYRSKVEGVDMSSYSYAMRRLPSDL